MFEYPVYSILANCDEDSNHSQGTVAAGSTVAVVSRDVCINLSNAVVCCDKHIQFAFPIAINFTFLPACNVHHNDCYIYHHFYALLVLLLFHPNNSNRLGIGINICVCLYLIVPVHLCDNFCQSLHTATPPSKPSQLMIS